MKIWIDADACPRIIKEIILRASLRLDIPVCMVANQYLSQSNSHLVTCVLVAGGFDAADDYIIMNSSPEDLVITADIPLASQIVANGGLALDPRGDIYTEDNVGERLSMRNLMQELRAGGIVRGGPAQLSLRDRQKFASALDRLLVLMSKDKR